MAKTRVDLTEAEESRETNLEYSRANFSATPAGTGPFAAIRRKCLDCTVWQPGEIAGCPMTDCALWPYRFGGDPWRKAGRLSGAALKATQS